jgi:hypothetical protein
MVSRSVELANFEFVERESTAERLVIRDLGPWHRYMTVTNAAEWVVDRLSALKRLKPGMRLFYYDSAGEYTEIVLRDGRFWSFAPAVNPLANLGLPPGAAVKFIANNNLDDLEGALKR